MITLREGEFKPEARRMHCRAFTGTAVTAPRAIAALTMGARSADGQTYALTAPGAAAGSMDPLAAKLRYKATAPHPRIRAAVAYRGELGHSKEEKYNNKGMGTMAFGHPRYEMHRHQVPYEAEDQPIGALTYTSIDVPGANLFAAATAINNRGVVAGEYSANLTDHAFIYNHGIVTTIDPPGSRGALAQGINDFGEVVGTYINSNSEHLGFTFVNGAFSTIDVPAANLVINNHGEVTGSYFDSNGIGEHGFIYESGAVTPLDVPGATQTDPVGINNGGEIAGNYVAGGSRLRPRLVHHHRRPRRIVDSRSRHQ